MYSCNKDELVLLLRVITFFFKIKSGWIFLPIFLSLSLSGLSLHYLPATEEEKKK